MILFQSVMRLFLSPLICKVHDYVRSAENKKSRSTSAKSA